MTKKGVLEIFSAVEEEKEVTDDADPHVSNDST